MFSSVEGDDFNIMSPLKLTFLPTSDTSQVLCVNISIVSDGVVEGAESFQVNLAGVGLPELVIVQPFSAVVNIIDGDGRFAVVYHIIEKVL